MSDTYKHMDLLQLRAECQKRVDESRPGWHNDKQWIRFGRAVELRAALEADKAPESGKPTPAPTPAPLPEAPKQDSPAPAPEPVGQAPMPGMDALGQLLAGVIQPYLKQQKVDISVLTEKVDQQIASLDERVQKKIDDLRPVERIIFIDRDKGTRKEVSRQHKQFQEVSNFALTAEPRRQNIWLTGPAGTGKSMMSRVLAEQLGLPYFIQSCGAGTQEYHIWGHTDANGAYMQTPTYKAFTQKGGAVLNMDEVDAAAPEVMMCLNALTNGDEANFPHPIGCLPRPENLIIFVTGNTLNGADARYGARNEPDGAFADRFLTVKIDHDLDFEAHLYPDFPDWRKYVQACREAVDTLRLPYVVSSRAIARGSRLLAAGDVGKRRIEEVALWGDGRVPASDVKKVQNAVKEKSGLVWA